jgi:hypothetical protein
MTPTPTIRGHQAQGSRNETAGTDQRTAQEAFALQSVLNADGPTDSRRVLGSGTQQSAVRPHSDSFDKACWTPPVYILSREYCSRSLSLS